MFKTFLVKKSGDIYRTKLQLKGITRVVFIRAICV